ncbi:hypothetical protein WJX72_002976 [[Myrmecia] bisecta]|uniref:RRM domain-containing protein n=1 Tax=[Myrmecia] bisecta TaxID=41462 RepID=A0AAW1P6U9_9CHLO
MIDKPTPTPKRQRQFEDPPRPSSKKQATNVGPQSDQRELYRAEITRVYKSYNVLLDPPSQEQALVAFQGLLTAAQGSCGARRLAARLVPKFLDRFPSLLDASATCLLGLVCSPPAADHRSAVKAAFAAAAAADALQGLVTLCKAALTAADGEAVVTRVVFFLLRRCGPAQPKNHSNGTRERDGGGREVDDASQVLLSAFTGACRVVLSALLKALQDGPEMQAGAEHFITKQLLGASQEPQGALGSKAHSNGSASPAQVSKIPGKTSRSGVCRAAQILSQHPDTHRLLLDAVKHAPKGSSTDQLSQMDHLHRPESQSHRGLLNLLWDHPSLVTKWADQRPMLGRAHLSVIYLAPDRQDQVYVTFTDIRDAAVCYERMSGEAIWGGRPLQVRFCEYEPGGTATARSGEQAQLHVWVGGVRSSSGEEEVMRTLAEARVMMPQNVLRVAGAKPGLVLQFASSRSVGPAVAALRLRVSKPASPPAKPPPPAPAMREPECRTLWVGQVGPEVDEEDILQAFRRYGNVVGHKFLRRSHCAFIDFDKPSAAAAAKNALVGARFGPCQIRLEFKDERRPGGGGPVGPSFRGAGDEPRRPYSPPGGPPHRDSFVGSFRDGYSRDAGPRGRAPLREDPLPGRPPHRVSHPPASQRTSPSGPPGIWGRSRERSPPSPGHWWGGPSPGRPSDTPSHRQSQWDTGSDQLPRSTGRTSKWGPATGTPSAESTPAGDTGSKWGPAVADSVLPPGMSSRLGPV